jgi:hypothetical protein
MPVWSQGKRRRGPRSPPPPLCSLMVAMAATSLAPAAGSSYGLVGSTCWTTGSAFPGALRCLGAAGTANPGSGGGRALVAASRSRLGGGPLVVCVVGAVAALQWPDLPPCGLRCWGAARTTVFASGGGGFGRDRRGARAALCGRCSATGAGGVLQRGWLPRSACGLVDGQLGVEMCWWCRGGAAGSGLLGCVRAALRWC